MNVFIISKIEINHNFNIENIKKIINFSLDVDVVKFQKFSLEFNKKLQIFIDQYFKKK